MVIAASIVLTAVAAWAAGYRVPVWYAALACGALALGAVVACLLSERRLRVAEVSLERLNEETAALRQMVRQGQSVLAHTPNGVISVDCDGRITLFNPSAQRMFGKTEAAVLGQKIEDVDIHPELARLAYECIASEATSTTELRLPGWPVRVLSARVVPTGGRSQGSDCAMFVIQDVSEIRKRQMHEREFVGNVSHELRTPVTAVMTTTEALLAGAKNDPEVVDRFLGTIMSESKRLSALIEDLLELTKRDYGMEKSQITEVLVGELVERAVSAVRPQAGVKRINIDTDVPGGMVAWCDETQTLRLVRNLADNAVKYTHEGGKVDIVAREEGAELVISVADTGIGIPQGEVERIFERFYRVDKARSRRMGGTGLGLAIVKDIVDSCGGTISVDTQLGCGSTFTVRLPMRPEIPATDVD